MSELIAAKMSLLIVEDEDAIRELLCETLSEAHSCAAVATAEEALELLAEQHFDVILTDITLPGISGLALVRKMYRLHPDVCVIVMSGAPLNSQHEWSALGVFAYLIKPFALSEVERQVERAVARCRLRSSR